MCNIVRCGGCSNHRCGFCHTIENLYPVPTGIIIISCWTVLVLLNTIIVFFYFNFQYFLREIHKLGWFEWFGKNEVQNLNFFSENLLIIYGIILDWLYYRNRFIVSFIFFFRFSFVIFLFLCKNLPKNLVSNVHYWLSQIYFNKIIMDISGGGFFFFLPFFLN